MLRVGRDDVDRAPDRRQLGVMRRLVELVAAVPPALRRAPGRARARPPRARARRCGTPPTATAAGSPSQHDDGADAVERLADDGRERARASPPRRTCGSPTAGSRRRAWRGRPRCRRRRSGSCSVTKRRSARQRDDLERRAGDDPERALGADEELRELRARRRGAGPRRCRSARRSASATRSESDEVLDLAVARGEHAGAARGDVAADGRPLRRGRVVREHQAALVERALEHAAVDAGLGRDASSSARRSRRSGRARAGRSTSPPCTGTAPPCVPEPPPQATTGTPYAAATRSAAATSSSLRGIATTSGRPSGVPFGARRDRRPIRVGRVGVKLCVARCGPSQHRGPRRVRAQARPAA